MKKRAALLTIVIFAGLGLGLICDCCPQAFADSPSTIVITNSACDCCPGTSAFQAGRLNLAGDPKIFRDFSFARVLGFSMVAVARIDNVRSPFEEISFSDASPPGHGLKTPLYLTLQILRI